MNLFGKYWGVLLGLVMIPYGAGAQKRPQPAKSTLSTVTKRLDKSQQSFEKVLGRYPMDTSGKAIYRHFIITETDSLQQMIVRDPAVPISQKILALNCRAYLLDTLKTAMSVGHFDLGLLKESRAGFLPLWQSISQQRSCEAILQPFRPQTTGLMAVVFRDYPQSDKIKELSQLKLLEQSPEKILIFLGAGSDFGYRDSLLYILANRIPDRLVATLLESNNERLKKLIRQNPYPLVRTLVTMAGEKNPYELLPFAEVFTEGQMSMPDIEALRLQPCEYFKRIVDLQMRNRGELRSGGKPAYTVPLRNYLKTYAVKFFIDIINLLHNESQEKDRFFVLDDLRPQDLYYLVTNGEDDLYTSSYLYTYRKLVAAFRNNGNDSLFRLVGYDQYRKFLLMAGRYNTLIPFLQGMPRDSMVNVVVDMMGHLEDTVANNLEAAINVTESFPGLVGDDELFFLAKKEIGRNHNRCAKMNDHNGTVIYRMLGEMLELCRESGQGGPFRSLPFFNRYYRVPYDSLLDEKGELNALAIFYGDEDGRNSFTSFLSGFSDPSAWSIEKNEQWILIRSKKNERFRIYANLPLDDLDGKDEEAIRSLSADLASKQVLPRVMILRGHSYYMHKSFEYLNPEVKLVVSGSCGSYMEMADILSRSPAAQVIASKQIGSMLVNEPILKQINGRLSRQLDLEWQPIWQEMEGQFSNNKVLYDYFKAYVPPNRNIALMSIVRYKQLIGR